MINEFQNLGIEIKQTRGQVKTKCPQCHHTRKNKSDRPLSVDIDNGLYNCHNCGFSGNVKFKEKKEFIKPPEVKVNLSDRTLQYFKKRGINESTLSHWKVGESTEYFPQVNKRRKAINFNYYLDNELINVKYRDGQKNFKLVSGAKLIFYGLDSIKDSNKVYIVEGEMDALSLHEAGIYSVCSVPNGASKGNQRLEYLDNCFEYFENKTEIVLCTDNDEAGLNLRNELARRFGKHRCKYIDFDSYKDANEVLTNDGAEKLRQILKDAKEYPLEGIVNFNDIWDNVLNYNENGLKSYSIGLGDSDEWINISMDQWTTITGIPNSGKSDVVDQICCNMALQYDFRVAMYSPESYPYEGHIKRIANKLNKTNCNNDLLNKSKNFIEEHFFFVKIDLENLTLKGILDSFKQLVFRKGVNLCVIDPYNMLDHSAQRDVSYVGKILSEITQFCQQTNTHLFLVAHPRKMEFINNQYRVPNPYDISGSSDFFNKSYNCLTVFRNLNQPCQFGSDTVSVHVQKVKRRENGKQGEFMIAPNFKEGGYYTGLDKDKQRIQIIKDNTPF